MINLPDKEVVDEWHGRDSNEQATAALVVGEIAHA